MDSHSESPCETLAERYQALLEVAQAISTHRDLDELFRDLAQRLPRVVHVNFVALSLHDPARDTMRLHSIQANVPADLVGGMRGRSMKAQPDWCGRRSSPSLYRMSLKSSAGRRSLSACRRMA